VAAGFLLAAGMFGKFAAIISCIPVPVLGGQFIIGTGMLVSMGLSTLQFVNMSSSRNQVTLGVALIMGVSIPIWLENTPNAINTGSNPD